MHNMPALGKCNKKTAPQGAVFFVGYSTRKIKGMECIFNQQKGFRKGTACPLAG